MFSRIRSVMASLCMLSLLLSLAPVAQVAVAQNLVTGEASGISVTIEAGWVHDVGASSGDGAVDSLVFSNGSTQFIVSGGTVDINESFGLLNIIYPVSDIEVAATYALRGVDFDGHPFGVFQVASSDHVQTVIAPVSGFADAIGSAQSGIQVDGVSVMSGVDGTGLAAAIAGTMGSGEAASDASAPALLGDGESVEEAVADDSPATAESDDEVEETTAEAAEVIPDGATGFVNDHTFVSPQFGTAVTWNDSWDPWLDADGTPRVNSVESEFGAYDSLCLDTSEPGVFWTVCFDFEAPNDFTADRFASYSDPEANASYGIPHFGVVMTDTGVSYTSTDLEGNARVIQEEIINGVLVETRLYAEIEALADIVEIVQGDIQVEGEAAYSLIDAATYRAEIDNMAASIPALIAEREQNLASMGLLDPYHYVSTAYGCDVAWSESHYLSQLEMNPVTTYEEWFDSTGENVQVESFYLSALDPPYIGYLVECFENIPALESWWAWTVDAEATQIEGERALYLVRPSGDAHDVTIIVKPVGKPTLVVRFFANAADIGNIQNGEPGLLTLNGIDITEFLQEDDLLSQLP